MPIHNFCSWTSFFASKMSEMNLDIYWTVFVQQSVKFNSHHFLLTLNKIKRSDFPLEKACHIKKGKNKKKNHFRNFWELYFLSFTCDQYFCSQCNKPYTYCSLHWRKRPKHVKVGEPEKYPKLWFNVSAKIMKLYSQQKRRQKCEEIEPQQKSGTPIWQLKVQDW